MTDHQVVTAATADHRPHTSPEGTAFRRLLTGTVFDPRTAESDAARREEPREDHRPTTAQCRYAMSYVD